MADPDRNFTRAATRLSGLATLWLGWTPDQFWAATPAEIAAIWAAMADVRHQNLLDDVTPPSPATLHRLMEKFPDGQS